MSWAHQAYILESVKSLASLKSHHMKIQWEEGTIEGEFIFGMITNTTSVGGFKGLTPRDVDFDDGMFEALFIRTPKTPSDLSNIVSYMFLKDEENAYVFRFHTSRVVITAKRRGILGLRRRIRRDIEGDCGGEHPRSHCLKMRRKDKKMLKNVVGWYIMNHRGTVCLYHRTFFT